MNRKGLLLNQDKGYCEEQWIELEEVNPNKLNPKQINSRNPYQRLKEAPQQTSSKTQNTNKMQTIISNRHEQHNTPKVISINGDVWKEVEKEKPEIKRPPQKKSKLPSMFVSCFYCTTVQSVNGTLEKFCCVTCQKINECTPNYGIFVCGVCSAKVCYATGTSDLIRCTKCGQVNKVPTNKKTKNQYEKSYNKSPYQRDQIETIPYKQEYAGLSEAQDSQQSQDLQMLCNQFEKRK